MKLVEAIKTLRPGERLKALVILALISSLTGLITVWLKGNPCKEISTQYTEMLHNYSEIAKSNNSLMSDNNQKQEIIISLKRILEKIDSSKSETIISDVVIDVPVKQQVLEKLEVKDNNTIADSHEEEPIILADECSSDFHPLKKDLDKSKVHTKVEKILQIRKTTKTTVGLNKSQRSLLDSALIITRKIKS
jgi:hypothetical protein